VQSKYHELSIKHRQLIETSPQVATIWNEVLQQQHASGTSGDSAAMQRLSNFDLRHTGANSGMVMPVATVQLQQQQQQKRNGEGSPRKVANVNAATAIFSNGGPVAPGVYCESACTRFAVQCAVQTMPGFARRFECPRVHTVAGLPLQKRLPCTHVSHTPLQLVDFYIYLHAAGATIILNDYCCGIVTFAQLPQHMSPSSQQQAAASTQSPQMQAASSRALRLQCWHMHHHQCMQAQVVG
jgi:hypothetical protein